MRAAVAGAALTSAPVDRDPVRRFWILLAAILLLAAGVRIAYVLGVADGFNRERFYDAAYYELEARTVAQGKGFADPFRLLPGADHAIVPAADHPPLTVLALAPVVRVFPGQLPLRFASALAGLGVVLLTALLARALAGDRAALIAAFLAACYPYLWVNDGLIMSESFTGLFVVGALLAVYRAVREPRRWWRWVLVGALGGFATLGRAELALLVPLLMVGVLLGRRVPGWRVRAGATACAGAAMLVVLAPWFVYNAGRFEERVLISTNDGLALVASNCDETYAGPAMGLTILAGPPCLPDPVPGDQSVVAKEYRRIGFEYMGDHLDRLPLVVLARAGRDWSLFRPADMIDWNLAEGRPSWVTRAGLFWYYPLLAAAIVGAVVLRRRRAWLWPLLVPPIVVTLGTVLAFGQTRFRAPAEPVLVVLAAVALAALTRRGRSDGPVRDAAAQG